MASRMDRYYKDELINQGRSTKNKSLYEQIDDLHNYTNIEGVATIENTNEIDLSKVQELLKSRESSIKQRQFRRITKEEEQKEEPVVEEVEETKNYDINDLLSKVKEESSKNPDRSLTKEQYELLKSLNLRQKESENKKEEKTLENTKSFVTDDIGLLDELKSNTMVGDASSIKKILEEEKQNHKMDNTSTMEIDKTFYTSSMGFTRKDFEELKDMNHKLKDGNKFIIILLVSLISIVVIVTLILLLK